MKHVDGHCHFFNIQYAFREALKILWDFFLERYPHDGRKKRKLLAFVREDEKMGLIKYIASLANAAARSCEEQYDFEQKKYKESQLGSNSDQIVTVPLMMDIYYIFDKDDTVTKKSAPGVSTDEDEQIFAEQQEQFLSVAESLKDDVLTEVSKIGYDEIAALNQEISGKDLEQKIKTKLQVALDDFIGEISADLAHDKGRVGYRLSWGYKKHMEELKDLSEQHRETVIPFLAVDPRRYNIIELVREKVGPDKPFKGIKLYPALGYLPAHPNLFPVYDFCVEFDIPITLHASPGGLPSLTGSIYVKSKGAGNTWFSWDIKTDPLAPCRYFGEPKHWREVLDAEQGRYRVSALMRYNSSVDTLQDALNKELPPENWTGQIIDLMEDFNNVYSDLSYCTDPKIVELAIQLVHKYPVVAERGIFGTDYIMIMKERDLGGLKNYFDHFEGLPNQMFFDNGRRFLGL